MVAVAKDDLLEYVLCGEETLNRVKSAGVGDDFGLMVEDIEFQVDIEGLKRLVIQFIYANAVYDFV